MAFCFWRRPKEKNTTAIIRTAHTTPITIPVIAPPDKEDPEEESLFAAGVVDAVTAGVGVADEEDDVEADVETEVGEAVEVRIALEIETEAVSSLPTILTP